MRRGKKAVSEIVAAMMLISITVAATFVIYVYSSNLLGSLTGAQPQSGQYSNQITLEYYDWTNTGSSGSLCNLNRATPDCTKLKLTIRNVGSGLANIAAYYVSGTQITIGGVGSAPPICSGTATSYVATTTITTGTVASKITYLPLVLPQGSCTVTLTMPTTGLTITPGVAYTVKIATSNGGVFVYSCVAGQRTGSY